MREYSVGITTYNCETAARHFVDSPLLTDREAELVVVDAGSDDGTRDVLRQFDGPVQIETIDGCTRGEGRQRAVELAQNDHIINEVDPDVRFSGLGAVLDAYERMEEQHMALLVRGNNGVLISPTSLIERYPYRPLQYREDHALHDKLYKEDSLRILGPVPAVEEEQDTRVERTQLSSCETFVAKEPIKHQTVVEYLSAWYRDVQAMYRIGFSKKQILTYNIRTTSLRGMITIPVTVTGLAMVDGPRFSDALAHCADELDQPLRHECYSDRVKLN